MTRAEAAKFDPLFRASRAGMPGVEPPIEATATRSVEWNFPSIDTAPKDGTPILAFVIHRWKVVWWHKTQRTIPEQEGWYDGWDFETVTPDCWTDVPPDPRPI